MPSRGRKAGQAMTEMSIECPSGLRGVVRGMKTPEFDALADRKGMRTGTSFDRILAGCWVKTEDGGRAYSDSQLGPIRWSLMLTADRFYALTRIRAATWGDIYKFRIQCPGCGEWAPNEQLNLSELPYKRIPDVSCAAFRERNNRHDIWVPDPAGRKPPEGFLPATTMLQKWDSSGPDERAELGLKDPALGWAIAVKILDGATEVRGAKEARRSPHERVTISVKHRLVDILHDELRGDPRAVERWLKHLDGEILYDMRDAAEAFDGGIETEIEDFTCGGCGWEPGEDDPLEIPFDRGFWMPRRPKKKSSKGKRRKR